jgi:hypothetical protein
MAKGRKQSAAPRTPKVGDKVIPPRSSLVYTIARVSKDGTEVDLNYDDSNLHRFPCAGVATQVGGK